jgi:catechol 2,3-dioxygenase-like lactoylglutathione lyase family enzyme
MEVNMTSADATTDSATASAPPSPGEYRLEVITIPVSDVDRAKAFYEGLGWRLDIDFEPAPGVRAVQFTPTGSGCSISFGKGITDAEPGSIKRMEMAVHDIDASREDLIAKGVEVGDLYHLDGGPKPGPDPDRRSYNTYAEFSDPDGNGFVLQEIRERLPGR